MADNIEVAVKKVSTPGLNGSDLTETAGTDNSAFSDFFPGLPKTIRQSGPGTPCKNPKCGKPIPPGKRKDAEHCNDDCRREHDTIMAIEKELKRQRDAESRRRTAALDWLELHPDIITWLRDEALEDRKAGKKANFRRLWENCKNEFLEISFNNNFQRTVREVVENSDSRLVNYFGKRG